VYVKVGVYNTCKTCVPLASEHARMHLSYTIGTMHHAHIDGLCKYQSTRNPVLPRANRTLVSEPVAEAVGIKSNCRNDTSEPHLRKEHSNRVS
jgi:hypothetical protein